MDSVGELFSLRGRTALVTGASSGIGKMIAKALLIAGAEVWLVARDQGRLDDAEAALRAHGRVRTVAADITRDDHVAGLVETVGAATNGLHVLVNNAGVTRQAPLGAFPGEHWDLLDINLKAPFMLIQAMLPQLRRAAISGKPANVINIGSGAGISVRTAGSFSYYASKAGIHHLSRVLAKTLVGDRICVNVIAPGYFRTELIDSIAPTEEARASLIRNVPLGRFGDENDIAAAILFLAANSFVTGQILAVEGGFLLDG